MRPASDFVQFSTGELLAELRRRSPKGMRASRLAMWLSRAAILTGVVAVPAMLIAAIWVDWRWSLTAVVALLVSLFLAGMGQVFGKVADKEGVRYA